jgi:hypothetical protein
LADKDNNGKCNRVTFLLLSALGAEMQKIKIEDRPGRIRASPTNIFSTTNSTIPPFIIQKHEV